MTAEQPWAYVKKELIEDNMELHDESSTFLCVQREILKYPEDEILLGFIPEESQFIDRFYIVLTLDAKKKVLELINQREAEIQEKLKNSVFRFKVKKFFALVFEP